MTCRIHFLPFSPLEREEWDPSGVSGRRGLALLAPVSTGGTGG